MALHKRFIDNVKTELFISVRLNFIAVAFTAIQLYTLQYWPANMSVKEAVMTVTANFFLVFLLSFIPGIYRQYLKK